MKLSIGRIRVEGQKLFTKGHVALLRKTRGKVGGQFGKIPVLVLHTSGRTSGLPRTTPLAYTKDGDAYVLIASDGGARRNPDWYANLVAHPEAEVEVNGRRQHVTAETVTGAERDRLWAQATASYGAYEAYQGRTEREIPVVRLRP